ncbi:uncharacterized protein LOC128680378 isoform X2 [Plodia interpunctella]|uniref:uncharacterized protein LOC128680378 isoform X2 n=1 Tax=Plodia interpunctella TaxID=58824 RepID=UPI002367F586|nr:uncharacterized protein LOC128680378 isoform X2 [Plodia interpunctella]
MSAVRVFIYVTFYYSVNYIETSYVDSTEKFDLTYPPTNTFTPTFYEDMTPVIANLTGPTSAEYPETTESPKNDSIWNVSWYIPPHRRGRTPMPYFKFEGVEYNELPEGHLYENNNDCDSYHNQCIRDEPFHQPVCAYDTDWNYWYEFFSICQVELENCWYKFLQSIKMREQTRPLERYYFAGEGYDCLTFARMGKMEEAYFDPKRNTRRSASELMEMQNYVKQQIKIKGPAKLLKHHSMKSIANVLNAYKLACPL